MSIVKQNIIANFGGKAWQAIMSIAFVPLYIKFMGMDSYGLMGMFTSMFAVFGILDMGLSNTLNRELARLSILPLHAQEMRDLVRTLEIPYWVISIIIGLGIVGLSGPIAHYWLRSDKLSPEIIKQALMIMGGVIAFRFPVGLYSGGLMGLQKQVLLNFINILVDTFRGVGSVMILWLVSPTIQAFFIWQIIISVLHVLLVTFFLWSNLPKSTKRPQFKKKSLIQIWRFAAGMAGITITSVMLTQTDKIILSKLLSLQLLGYYTLATVVANTLYFFISPIFVSVFPRFSQLVSINDPNALKILYHKSCQLMSVMILPAAIIVSLFSAQILLLWTNDVLIVSNSYLVVSIFIIGTAINGLMNLPYGLQIANGWTKLSFYSNIIASVFQIPLIYLFSINFGVIGAASAWLILNVCLGIISVHIMHSRLLQGEKWKWYVNDVGRPFLSAFIISMIWRLLIPNDLSKSSMVIYIFLASITSLIASAFTTNATRVVMKNILSKFK